MRWVAVAGLLGGVGVVLVACEDSSSSSSSSGDSPDASVGSSGSSGTSSGSSGSSSSSSGDDGGPANECAAPAGPGTQHTNNVNAPETWTAAGSPHVVVNDLTIQAKVTVEPCAVVVLGEQKTLSIGTTGTLSARGTATKRIHFGAKDPTKPFARVRATGGGKLDLAYADFDGGGDPQNTVIYGAGTIDVQGSSNSVATQPLIAVDHVTVKGSKSNGIVLRDGAGFLAESTALTITGSAAHPLSVWSRAVDGVPDGTYTGNAIDEILLPALAGNEAVRESATMHDRGVPYRIGQPTSQGTFYVATGAAGVATLTIEPGVILKVIKGGGIYVEPSQGLNAATGALVAKGTAAKPIVLTSAEATPAAGDWRGIWFGQTPDASNALDYVRVEYAGGDSVSGSDSCIYDGLVRNDAAIRVFGVPSKAFVTNTTIMASLHHGIDRGYRSDSDVDFLPTNTFLQVANCKQTENKAANGGCPATPSCPQ